MATDDDIDRWSEELAGRRAPGASDTDGTGALRRSIRAEDAVLQSAGAQDRVGLERLLRRLETEGLLGATAPPTRRSRSFGPWLAAAATVAALAIGIRLLPPPGVTPQPTPPAPVEKPRGYAGVIKQSVPDPAAAAVAAAGELVALGLQPRDVPADGRRIVEVDVDAAHLDAFRGWAEPRGGRVNDTGRYRLIFEPGP